MWDVMLRRWLDLLFWWAPKKDRTPRRAEQEARKRGSETMSKPAQPSARPVSGRPDQRPARAAGRTAPKPAARPASGPAAVRPAQSVRNGAAPTAAGARGAATPTAAPPVSGASRAAEPGASGAPEPKTTQPEKAVTAPVPDDLTVIKGIGPALQNRLRALGITTFADLAAANPDKLMAQLKGGQPLSRARVQHWTEAARARARP
jgi:predicted flap endonuclease-1-like 5' DNA nuclease